VEILREVGLDHAVNEAAVDLRAGKIRGRTLAEADFTESTEWKTKTAAELTYTPARIRGTCAQNRLDRVLITKAGDVEFGVALERIRAQHAARCQQTHRTAPLDAAGHARPRLPHRPGHQRTRHRTDSR
jgi:hypothetical protein